MPEPGKTSPSGRSDLLRMRSDSPDDQVTLARKVLDPAYIRSVLQKQSEKNWFNLQLQQSLRITQSKQPLVPRLQLHPGQPIPAVRQGEASDVLKALTKIPAVASSIEKVKGNVTSVLKRDWKRLSTGGKAALITQTFVMGAGSLSAVLASKQDRKELYELLRDREIPLPVPGVPGLKLQLKTGKEHRGVVTFDIAEFLRSR